MVTLLLDTNVVSEATRRHPDPEVLRQVSEKESEAAISAVTWHELHYGVRRLPPGRRRDGLTEFVDRLAGRFLVLAYDASAADWHATERVRLERDGFPVPSADAQIAATAVTHDLTLVTRNLVDFQRFRDLRVESWWG